MASITSQDAALTAEAILEFPADDSGFSWELQEFREGWLVNRGGQGNQPGELFIVIERGTGLVRYFTTVPPLLILNRYAAVRDRGHPDDRWVPWC